MVAPGTKCRGSPSQQGAIEGASESNRAKTAETLLELLGARVRKKRSREFRSGRNNERRGTLGEYGPKSDPTHFGRLWC